MSHRKSYAEAVKGRSSSSSSSYHRSTEPSRPSFHVLTKTRSYSDVVRGYDLTPKEQRPPRQRRHSYEARVHTEEPKEQRVPRPRRRDTARSSPVGHRDTARSPPVEPKERPIEEPKEQRPPRPRRHRYEARVSTVEPKESKDRPIAEPKEQREPPYLKSVCV